MYNNVQLSRFLCLVRFEVASVISMFDCPFAFMKVGELFGWFTTVRLFSIMSSSTKAPFSLIVSACYSINFAFTSNVKSTFSVGLLYSSICRLNSGQSLLCTSCFISFCFALMQSSSLFFGQSFLRCSLLPHKLHSWFCELQTFAMCP